MYQLFIVTAADNDFLLASFRPPSHQVQQLRSEVRSLSKKSGKVPVIAAQTKWIRKNTAKKRKV